MKRFLLILTAALLLTACTEPAESTEQTVEQTAEQTSALTTTAVPIQTEPQQTEQSAPTGGVSLTNEHEELRKEFSGADEYCDYSELGLTITVNNGFIEKAFQLAEQSEGFDDSYDRKRYSSCLGIDGGNFYFAIMYTYDIYSEEFEGWLVGYSYKDYYFCYNCDTNELTQISAPSAYPTIVAINNKIMVLRNDSYDYVAIYRDSGFIAELSRLSGNYVLIDDTVYYQFIDEERGLVRVSWTVMSDNSSSRSTAAVFDQPVYTDTIIYPEYVEYNPFYAEYSVSRGVYNVVCPYSDYTARALNNSTYLIHDTRSRVRDYVFETYYAGTVAAEDNLLGTRLRFSIWDRNDTEYVLGYAQAGYRYVNEPYSLHGLRMHSTKDGVIFIDKEDALLLLAAEPDNMGYVKAAYLPEDIFASENYDVYCDFGRIYLFDSETQRLVTVYKGG